MRQALKNLWTELNRPRALDLEWRRILVAPLKNSRGVAILLALSFVTLMMFLATEVSFDSQVEYQVSMAEYDRLKAYYAAKAGIELSLLRVELFSQAYQTLGKKLGPNASMLDLIWNFPFLWPPVAPPNMDLASKDQLETSVKESFMDAEYTTTIEPETGKIDVNDLASPSQALQKLTHDQIVKILQDKIQNDTQFQHDNASLRADELVNNIADYIDEDNVSRNGGNEGDIYREFPAGTMPPNRPMVSLQELHMIPGMTDQIYAVLLPSLTVYGAKGVNVNRASKEVLVSLDPQITDQIADAIIKWVGDTETAGKGPFADLNAFKTTLNSLGVNTSKFNPENVPLYFGADHVFRVKSTGHFGRASREIIAIVYDFDTVKQRLQTMMTTTTLTQPGAPVQQPPTTPPASTPTSSDQSSGGKPRIVDWIEN